MAGNHENTVFTPLGLLLGEAEPICGGCDYHRVRAEKGTMSCSHRKGGMVHQGQVVQVGFCDLAEVDGQKGIKTAESFELQD